MNTRQRAFATVMASVIALAISSASGQTSDGVKSPQGGYEPSRTADGQPNISGMWEPGPDRPMETPRGRPWEVKAQPGTGAAYTFFAPGDPLPGGAAADKTKPMVVDPPNGIIPLQPWAESKRDEIMSRQDSVMFLDPRVRCLQSGIPRANLPVFYNSYQILQLPNYVVIAYEWNHMTRIIPLDGRPHLPSQVRLPNGDSRGRWEGNTLVVDVTNFNDETWVVGHGAPPEDAPASSLNTGHGVFHSDGLRVTERYTMTGADTIRYEATINDPKVFTKPWTIALDAFVRGGKNHQLFEYACHEGNRNNILLMTGVDIEK